MCYIDIHTIENMFNSLDQIFATSKEELYELFYKTNELSTEEMRKNYIYQFIEQRMSKHRIKYLYFFHYGRRLNTSKESIEGINLFELLKTETSLSSFFKDYGITFQLNKQRLDIFYNEKLIPLNTSDTNSALYLKHRLGHNDEKIDYCFNGFMFKGQKSNITYVNNLSCGPELLRPLAEVLDNPSIIDNYIEKSTYYCFEYLVPIDKVIFDGTSQLSKEEKQNYLLYQVLGVLFNYVIYRNDIDDNDNPILRLADNDIMEAKYFKRKEEISI